MPAWAGRGSAVHLPRHGDPRQLAGRHLADGRPGHRQAGEKLQKPPTSTRSAPTQAGQTLIILKLRESPPRTPPAGIRCAKIGDIVGTLPSVQGPYFNDGSATPTAPSSRWRATASYAEMKDYADFVRQQCWARAGLKGRLFGVQDEKINIEFSHKSSPWALLRGTRPPDRQPEHGRSTGVLVRRPTTCSARDRRLKAVKPRGSSCAPTAPPSAWAASPPSSAARTAAEKCASTARK